MALVTSITQQRPRPVIIHQNIPAPMQTPWPLVSLFASPRFPEGYHEPVWRILDATTRIKQILRVKERDDSEGRGVQRKLSSIDIKVIWGQLEAIGDVISRFTADVESSLAKTKELVLDTQKIGQGSKADEAPLLFELLNLDDIIKGMHHLPAFSVVVHASIIAHLDNFKHILAHHLPCGNSTTNNSSSASSVHSLISNISTSDLLDLPTQYINSLHWLIQISNSLLALNNTIKTQHVQVARRLQMAAIAIVGKESKPTRECIRHLSSALKIIRSAVFPPDSIPTETSDQHASNDNFYTSLLPIIRKATSHIKVIYELGLNTNMDTNKDAVLPFYLELMRYTRGIVDESPLSKLGSERGLGVGYLGKSEATGISRISRRFSLSAGSLLTGESGLRVGIKDRIKDWVKKPNGEKKQVSFSGIWKLGVTSFSLTSTTSCGQKLAKTLKRKQKSAHLSDSFMAQSDPKQISTESLPRYSIRSSYGDKRAGFWISDDHRIAQEEWEELALMLNVQKCMCKTGWMAGTLQHLRGREGMGSRG
ncbi:hypothetical protein BDZ91DRAFT_803291 [Kalaharituber pfeilii]|nr:hypothetical protein BDZ91DRAFT_803291 [Kalaharituber pfeilii]